MRGHCKLALITVILASVLGKQAAAATAQEIAACFPDAVKFCGAKRGEMPAFFAELRIRACMLVHVNDVSPRCLAVFRAHGL